MNSKSKTIKKCKKQNCGKIYGGKIECTYNPTNKFFNLSFHENELSDIINECKKVRNEKLSKKIKDKSIKLTKKQKWAAIGVGSKEDLHKDIGILEGRRDLSI
jgi:hypothetical protein